MLHCNGWLCLDTAKGARTQLIIHNATGEKMQMSLAYRMTAEYVWYETKLIELRTGWNEVAIEQSANDFKTKSSDWQFTAGLWRPDDCRGLSLIFHNGPRTGRLFVEALTVTEKKE